MSRLNKNAQAGYLPRIRDTYCCIHVSESTLEEFVRQDTGSIVESKEAMVREDCPDAHEVGMQNALVRERGKARVGMNQLYTLPQDDSAEIWKESEKIGQRC